MSALNRILRELLNPTHLPWHRKPSVGSASDCHPQPPRDPVPVKPPDPECVTGPDVTRLGKIVRP